VHIDDQPGEMREISGCIADQGTNIRNVRHDRSVEDLEVDEAYLVFDVETNGEQHSASIIVSVEAAGYPVSDITITT
jgi:threonine dehydratase